MKASLRRLAHYDYWSDKLKRSILLDSQADLISYGMGERSIVEIADALDSGIEAKDITFIDGTVFRTKTLDCVYDAQMLPSYEELLKDKKNYAKEFLYPVLQYGSFLRKAAGGTVFGSFVCGAESAVQAADPDGDG